MNPQEIFRKDKLLEFLPTSFQSAKDRVAATTCFVVYAMCILYSYKERLAEIAPGILVLGEHNMN
jgi:hypothetical protein